MFGIDPEDYDLKAELANCCNDIGTVYLAQHKPTGQHVAVKKFRMDKTKEENNIFGEEILAMRQFNHPNIMHFHTAFVHNIELYVVSPLMCYGSSRDTMNNYFVTGFPELMVALILKDVAQGIEYLHKKGFIHRSIRSSHIFLNKTKAVLGGFRDCTTFLTHGKRIKSLHSLPPNSVKGLNWLAPEVLEQNLDGYTDKSDIYSLGITTCELANGVSPFSDMPKTLMLTEKIRGNQPSLLDYSTCPSEEVIAQAIEMDSEMADNFAIQSRKIYSQRTFTDSFHKFAEICMQRNPDDRPNITQLMNHPFFKQCKGTTLLDQFTAFGIEAADFNTIRDEGIQLSDFGDISLNINVEWDF